MGDHASNRRQLFTALEQLGELVVSAQDNLGCRDVRVSEAACGSPDRYRARDEIMSVRFHPAIEHDQSGLFFSRRDSSDEFVAGLHTTLEMKILRGDGCARAGQFPVQEAG